MPILSPRLRRLDGALASLADEHGQAMLLSTADGYLAGIALCPIVIPQDEWLPEMWAGAAGAAAFADERDAAWFAALVSDHAAAILRALDKKGGRHQPFIEVDVAKGETLWELWIEGFAAAVDLRPDAWSSLTDERAVEAFAGLQTLIAIAFDESDLDRQRIDSLTDQAPDLIPTYLHMLYEAHRGRNTPSAELAAVPDGKIGRNDPCPCGSGKKHKKCCMSG